MSRQETIWQRFKAQINWVLNAAAIPANPDPCHLETDALNQAGIEVDAAIAHLAACMDALIACRARNPNFPEPQSSTDISSEMNSIKSNLAVMHGLRQEIAWSMKEIEHKQKRGP